MKELPNFPAKVFVSYATADLATVDMVRKWSTDPRVEVFVADAILDAKWHGAKSFIKVERSGIRKEKGQGKDYNQTHYYTSSLLIDADLIAPKIRGHWSIENKLHWVKDVVCGEDKSPIKDFNAATNLSILTTMGLNLFRLFDFQSITKGQRWLQGGLDRLFAC